MTLVKWALPQLSELLPLDEESLKEIILYTNTLSDAEATIHLTGLLGDTPKAAEFITSFNAHRSAVTAEKSKLPSDVKGTPPANAPPAYAPPAYPVVSQNTSMLLGRPHMNRVIEAANVRARDEQEMQFALQNLQLQYGIYNSEIEPEHESDYYCGCAIHTYQTRKYHRYGVQEMWSNAVMYPGEKAYNEGYYTSGLANNLSTSMFSSNPYKYNVISPYGMYVSQWSSQRPNPDSHAMSIHQTIQMNNSLNRQAQADIDAKEPRINIWDDMDGVNTTMSNMSIEAAGSNAPDRKVLPYKASDEKRQSVVTPPKNDTAEASTKSSKFSFRKAIGIKSSEERAVAKTEKRIRKGRELRNSILAEERGRWPNEQWQQIVTSYQDKVGMTRKIRHLRARQPIQYLHLLRAGYFEPIPVAWAGATSNPLKFSIEPASGWRGITPQWRGYEDTAEERLYWVLNHREGVAGMRMKPDFISAMDMARARMASAVEPPPQYYAANDTCHLQHTSPGYSKQVMPTPFMAYDRPEVPTDDTMILLDVSGSMDFDPVRPVYNKYLITGYQPSTQPKNKDVAKAIIRRFTDAMANHDHAFGGYSLTTFSNQAHYIGNINHQNLEAMWRNVRIGGGTRVMTGWQKVKDLHFQKHSASAIHHPVYGWQAGPETPMLRLLLLLDGEATDMDEFELDLLGLSWAHVTIFLIGVDGCPHHHRHANELQRISDVNHHVSFVDAQGNTPERFVTHELLKRHLGYEISMTEFEQIEELPAYSVSA
ncbi:hypothetical protein V501_03394 [Pseudogymnoascus sp. VKM F-4519 (FW-2642)]|nr:hypothetical protein V501_03394 [Pseudogymnoascus sp. VKM F-4519 (FW-2642)]